MTFYIFPIWVDGEAFKVYDVKKKKVITHYEHYEEDDDDVTWMMIHVDQRVSAR